MNGNGVNGQGGPWWARLFIQLGFPTALAILLIAALLGWLPSPIMKTLERMEYNAWQQTTILRAICYSSTNEANRNSCQMYKQLEP